MMTAEGSAIARPILRAMIGLSYIALLPASEPSQGSTTLHEVKVKSNVAIRRLYSMFAL